MKKITLLVALLVAFTMNAQTTLYEDDFESYDNFIIENIGDYTLVDIDGLPTYGFNGVTFENTGYTGSFIVFNSTATTPPLEPSADSDWTARSGEKALTCFAAVPEGGQFNDDWVITPEITLGSSGNLLEFWAKAADNTFSTEIFNVGVSTTDTDPSSFTFIAENVQAPALNYQSFTYNLDDYANETVYLAINVVSQDQFGFVMDDLRVSAVELSVDDQIFSGFNYFVDANNVLNLEAKTAMQSLSIYNVLGQQVMNRSLDSSDEAVSIASLKSGVYLVTVAIDGAQKTFKIVRK